MAKLLEKIFGSYTLRELKSLQATADIILEKEDEFSALTDAQLQGKTAEFKSRLEAGETLDDLLPEAFATVREASWRVLGMRHFPVQLVGGIVLHQGRIAEMKTGEGKTLVATLPAYLNALTGKGVHIVTVNDYLAHRDSEWMGKVYRFLGLSVGLVIPANVAEHKAAYECDITYGTNNEFGFDYLRDNMVIFRERMSQRGHPFAIVDEVDSILIDEARTPLIISGKGEESSQVYGSADRFVRRLRPYRIVEADTKELYDEVDADYIVDEKAKSVNLTKEGIAKAEAAFGVENLSDPENATLSHHINQAMRAHAIMHLDVDYVVREGQIIIVDEFTGRLMFGRRYSEGLHQAIEAKEGVTVAHESVTLATITFQNYFRLYEKLSGMTGTAKTEENEFREIYGLDVIPIPTNKPLVRNDMPDSVYRSEKAKFNAVIEQIVAAHATGQPVLVGTISIEKSELLAGMLSRRGVAHQVLNAKHHEKEAQIIAQAGKRGAVTIATNMAGRGTDIILGGNAEFMAKEQMMKDGCTTEQLNLATSFGETKDEEVLALRERYRTLLARFKEELAPEAQAVRDAGGLFIIGTERHESRRIDNQLRGRSGRQGDPGCSRFFLSLEDDLMRLFGSERIESVVAALKLEEDVPIEARILSNAIETAQSRVEDRNFSIRKHVLQYDDVMNQQREVIYRQRKQVLDGEDLKLSIWKMIESDIDIALQGATGESKFSEDWNLSSLHQTFDGLFLTPYDLQYTKEQQEDLTVDQLRDTLLQKAQEAYERKEAQVSSNIMRELERVIMLKVVDRQWMDHIDAMDQLRRGMNLRAYGQRDPVVEYKFEGSQMFEEMINVIKQETVRLIYTAQLRENAAPQREQVAKPDEPSPDGSLTKQPVRKGTKVGRNDPCPCGSGLKYKKCCGRDA